MSETPKGEHDELQKRVQEYLELGGLFNPESMHPQDAVRDLIIDLAAAIRDLSAKLETEREAHKATSRQANAAIEIANASCASIAARLEKEKIRISPIQEPINPFNKFYVPYDIALQIAEDNMNLERKLLATEESSANQYIRATAAEAALAKCFEETRERCVKVCNEHPGNLESNRWSAVGALRDCVARMRSIELPAAAQVIPSGDANAAEVTPPRPASAAALIPGLEEAARIAGSFIGPTGGNTQEYATACADLQDAFEAEIARLKAGE